MANNSAELYPCADGDSTAIIQMRNPHGTQYMKNFRRYGYKNRQVAIHDAETALNAAMEAAEEKLIELGFTSYV